MTAPRAAATVRSRSHARAATPVAALICAALLAGCASRPEPAPIVWRGSEPTGQGAPVRGAPATAPATSPAMAPITGALAPDARGVVDYGGYSAVVARQGDTVESMAARVGLSPSALASYNGLPAQHRPRPGDELILPPGAEAYRAEVAAAPAPAPVFEPAPGASAPAPGAVTTFDLDRIEAEVAAPPREAAPAPFLSAETPPATTPPAPAAQPAPPPPAETRAARAAPASAGAAFVAPVEGRVSRAYGGGGDGMEFAAPAGSAVRAAADGEVALVSQSLGGLGTIVLIRHQDQILTVYGRVDGVTVKRGDRVRRGDVIGAVAPGPEGGEAALHFEVRRGAESVDPAQFLG